MSGPDSISPMETASSARPIAKHYSRAIVLACGVALGGIALAKIGGFASDQHDTPSRAPALSVVVDRLDRIHDAFPALLDDRACPASFVPSTRIPLVELATLEAFRQGRSNGANALDIGALAVDASQRDLGARDRAAEADGVFRTIGQADHLAVLRTVSFAPARPALGTPEAGRYEGWLVVFDARKSTAVCGARVVAWSSRYVTEPGIAEHVMRADMVERIRSAVREAALRMSSSFVLDL